MTTKLKHRLPAYSVINHLGISDIQCQQLKDTVLRLQDEFKTITEANMGLVALHSELVKHISDSVYEINLTDSLVNLSVNSNTDNSKTDTYRKKIGYSTSNSILNEHTYTEKTKVYSDNSILFDSILSKFKGNPTRIRITKLAAGKSITPHIDYDPSYSVRIIIPIIGDEHCINLFWVKNKVESVILKPGTAYFLNTGYKHSVVNLSTTDRYALMISVNGSDDIKDLIGN